MNDCIFCKIIASSPQAFLFEEEDLVVIKDIAPKAPIHYLIIPKKHVKDIQSLDTQNLSLGTSMFSMAQKIAREIPQAQDFRFVINSGPASGQRVFHLHAHFLSGSRFDDGL